MPSGISHMMISLKAVEQTKEAKAGAIQGLLQEYRGPYAAGCVAPDLPYMSVLTWKKLIGLGDRSVIADDLHHRSTNRIPLEGFAEAKAHFEAGRIREARTLFAFYTGYCSHIVADGFIHPYVRDMVGDYEVARNEHRTLEMKLDIFIAMKLYGVAIDKISFQNELKWMQACDDSPLVYQAFAQILGKVYGHKVKAAEVKSWLKKMIQICDVTTGTFPIFYSTFAGNLGAAFKDLSVIEDERDSVLTLRMPVDAKKHSLTYNYRMKDKVDFFEDVLPDYFKLFPSIIVKAHDYVFDDGPPIDDVLPAIDLDSGRLIVNNDLKVRPAFLGMLG